MAGRQDSRLPGQRILVTGASGFIGAHVVREAAKRGARPLPGLRRQSSTAELEPWRESFRYMDLRSEEGLAEAVAGADCVIHLAGLTRARNLQAFRAVNRDGAGRLARACRAAGSRLRRVVLVSSLSASGPSGAGAPRREDDDPRPVTPYGRSKLEGEQALLQELGDALPWTIVRPPIVYGPGERDLFMVFRMCRRCCVPVVHGGRGSYSVVYGPDLAGAILELAVSDAASRQVVNVCAPAACTYRELVRGIAAAVEGTPRLLPLPTLAVRSAALLGSLTQPFRRRATLLSLAKLPEILATGWVADTTRLQALLPGACATPLDDGLARTAAWYREKGWL